LNSQWGKYGILRELDIFTKGPEFQAWLGEVKNISREALTRGQEKKYFKEYMEDFNTATFPSEKYYDLDRWFVKQQSEKQQQPDIIAQAKTDEERLRLERQLERKARAQQADAERVAVVYTELKKAREMDPALYAEIKRENLEKLLFKPTLESIAKQRKLEKQAAEKRR